VSVFRKRREAAGADAEPTPDDLVAEPSQTRADNGDDAGADTGRPPRPEGPWDASEIDDLEGYLDLGAIRMRGRKGMELRLEVDQASDRVTAVTVALGGSAVQLQAFAAPRSSGIWDEIRSEIASGVTRQGGTVDELPGPFGRELLARVPVRTPDGRTTHQAARFTGVDGPRWFLRAVFHGAAAYQPEGATELEVLVREIVVVRGGEAMAPRELLELRLPGAAGPEVEAAEQPSLDPFQRGPEITEIH
jgi:hypothetical protein